MKNKKTVTKAMKYKILKQTNTELTKSEFNKLLWDIQKEVRFVANKTTQEYWDWMNYEFEYLKENGIYPKVKDIKGYTSIDGYVYNILKSQVAFINSNILSSTTRTVGQKYKSNKKDILLGKKSIMSFRSNQPIEIIKNGLEVFKDSDGYKVKVELLNKSKSKELGLKTGKFELLIDTGRKNNTAKSIMDKTISGEYELNASKIEYDSNSKSFYFIMTYTKEIDDTILLDNNRILGIDLGIKYVAYASIYDKNREDYDWIKNNYIEGGEIEQFRKQIEARRLSMLKQSKYCGDGRKGHGISTLLKPTDKLQDKVVNFRDTCNHRYSRFIVDMAVKNNCGKIVMEDLSGVGEQSHFMKQWAYYDLQQKVEYKAKEFNIEVQFIHPQFTSQRCNKCGCIDKENRETQSNFVCTTCGHKDNADRNASRNIALPNIEEIIKTQINIK